MSTNQAAELAVATVRLWDVQQTTPQAKFFRLNPQEFQDGKTNNGLYNLIGEDIEQTPHGLIQYTRTWQERIPPRVRYGRKIEDAITDIAGAHGYPPNIRRTWYEHVNQAAIPVLAVDQDWENTINDIIRTWDTT